MDAEACAPFPYMLENAWFLALRCHSPFALQGECAAQKLVAFGERTSDERLPSPLAQMPPPSRRQARNRRLGSAIRRRALAAAQARSRRRPARLPARQTISGLCALQPRPLQQIPADRHGRQDRPRMAGQHQPLRLSAAQRPSALRQRIRSRRTDRRSRSRLERQAGLVPRVPGPPRLPAPGKRQHDDPLPARDGMRRHRARRKDSQFLPDRSRAVGRRGLGMV
ncbi:MAG: hypothetical protein BWZ10_00173 [candidate division BRC1 bacterium ADurb.BinA364]|nr:MAG: hypothetical protein BWZ10_00173 [candidate division BRC1 bacterium ADurb.BinA364]